MLAPRDAMLPIFPVVTKMGLLDQEVLNSWQGGGRETGRRGEGGRRGARGQNQALLYFGWIL